MLAYILLFFYLRYHLYIVSIQIIIFYDLLFDSRDSFGGNEDIMFELNEVNFKIHFDDFYLIF